MLLDTSVLIDGRLVEIVNAGAMQGGLIVPKFVINELQQIADSSEKLRRARGRRGLEMLQKLQNSPMTELVIDETDDEEIGSVDQKLIVHARRRQAKIVTNDTNLTKVANVRGIEAININELARSLRPLVPPGESLSVRVLKPGESAGQGVGYLEDGTMVVVENGRSHLDHQVDLIVTSTLQTSAGRMIFGKFAHEEDEQGPPNTDTAPPTPDAEPPATNNGGGPPPVPRKSSTGSKRNPRRG